MAAGRHNYSRASYPNRFDEETRSFKDRYGHRVSATTELVKSSGGRISDYRRGRFDGDGDGDRGRFVQPFDERPHGRNREVESGSTKKRKFSPIVWDRVEKQVKISSKSRVSATSSVSSDITRSSSPKSFKDFGRLEKCSVSAESELKISSVESLVSDVIDDVDVAATPEGHDQLFEKEDGEYEEPNLFKSKWALKDSPVKESDVNSPSIESGEYKLEGSERSGEVSSLSTEGGHFSATPNEDSQNVDKLANASMCYLSSESDSDDEAMLCTGIGLVPACRNVYEFERLGKISEGTYGVVHKARDLKTGDIVALKKVKTEKEREGFPVTALREINILGMLQHPSLVEMKEVVMDDFNGVYMVMEYVDHELKGYMERMKHPFSQGEVKRLMIQLLEGLSYLHDNYVMHRDLKTSNLLLNKDGELKICDFGMARQYASPLKPYTSLVVTLWYRAPELLLGMKNYSTAIDMWSVGCIMAELLSKKPLFDGGKELEQIDKIFRTLGTPNDSMWPGYSKLPGVKSNFVKQPLNCLRKKFPVATFTGSPTLTESGFDLLNKFLMYDPEKRITAQEALNHRWFSESPLPAEHVRICK